MRRWLWTLALAASPLSAQVVPDTVTVYVLTRPRISHLSCPRVGTAGDDVTAAFMGDTISCRIWATDSAGNRTPATFLITSTDSAVVRPLGLVNDSTLRIRLTAPGSAKIIVTAASPALVIGGILYDADTSLERFVQGAHIYGVQWVPLNATMCGYQVTSTAILAKSHRGCPGAAPVVPFTWSVADEPAEVRQAMLSWRPRDLKRHP